MTAPLRLAIVASHPVQYQAPWFRALAQKTDLTVLFCHRQDAAGQADAGFGVAFEWDVPLLDGYEHRWLENRSRQPGVSHFGGCDTPGIDAVVRDGRFDAVIVSGWYLKSYLQAIRACRRHGVPVFIRGDSQLATRRSAIVGAAKYLPYRWLLGHVDGHLYVGQANREYLRHFGVSESRLFFVPHFVDNVFFRRGAEAARLEGRAQSIRESAGAGRLTTLFVFAGKLIEKKRPADFIEALARARGLGIDARGLVVGAGPLAESTETLARQRGVPVLFAGFRNQSELPACYAASDAIVLPSDAGETWGLVVNEAMACGCPALVSRAAGCSRDLIEEHETGATFDMGDVDALAGEMTTLHHRLQADRDAFRAAVTTMIDRYDVTAAVGGTLEALESVHARRHQVLAAHA